LKSENRASGPKKVTGPVSCRQSVSRQASQLGNIVDTQINTPQTIVFFIHFRYLCTPDLSGIYAIVSLMDLSACSTRPEARNRLIVG
jgi:hypothetical protein